MGARNWGEIKIKQVILRSKTRREGRARDLLAYSDVSFVLHNLPLQLQLLPFPVAVS
jgi:hypothetical protein